jgi:hypothetical protein
MAKQVLFSGLQIPTEPKQFNKSQRNRVSERIWEDGVIKEVINSFDQLALLNEVEKISKRQW